MLQTNRRFYLFAVLRRIESFFILFHQSKLIRIVSIKLSLFRFQRLLTLITFFFAFIVVSLSPTTPTPLFTSCSSSSPPLQSRAHSFFVLFLCKHDPFDYSSLFVIAHIIYKHLALTITFHFPLLLFIVNSFFQLYITSWNQFIKNFSREFLVHSFGCTILNPFEIYHFTYIFKIYFVIFF